MKHTNRKNIFALLHSSQADVHSSSRNIETPCTDMQTHSQNEKHKIKDKRKTGMTTEKQIVHAGYVMFVSRLVSCSASTDSSPEPSVRIPVRRVL